MENTRVAGLAAFDEDSFWSNIPVIGGVVQWTQAAAQLAVRKVLDLFGTYERAKEELPEKRDAYTRAIVVARQSDDPAQRERVQQWGVNLAKMQGEIDRSDGAIQRVVSWARSVGERVGLGVLPVIPIAILGVVLTTAVIGITAIVRGKQENDELEMQIKAGFTPQQIVQAGMGGNTVGNLMSLAYLALGFFALKQFGGSK